MNKISCFVWYKKRRKIKCKCSICLVFICQNWIPLFSCRVENQFQSIWTKHIFKRIDLYSFLLNVLWLLKTVSMTHLRCSPVSFGRAFITHMYVFIDQKWKYFSGYLSGLWLLLMYNKGMNKIFADIWVPTFPFAP